MLLRALVDRWTVFGVTLSRRKTFTRCEVLVPADAPGRTNAGPSGEALCFVEQRFAEQGISFYSDATKATELLRVTEHPPDGALKKVAGFFGYPDTTYDVTDADGTRIGGIRKLFGQRTYHVSDASGTELLRVVQEFESIPITELAGWLLLRRPFANDRFAFWRGDRRLGWLHPDRNTQTDSTVDMTLDSDHLVDRRLSLAVSCLDLLRARDEGGG